MVNHMMNSSDDGSSSNSNSSSNSTSWARRAMQLVRSCVRRVAKVCKEQFATRYHYYRLQHNMT